MQRTLFLQNCLLMHSAVRTGAGADVFSQLPQQTGALKPGSYTTVLTRSGSRPDAYTLLPQAFTETRAFLLFLSSFLQGTEQKPNSSFPVEAFAPTLFLKR